MLFHSTVRKELSRSFGATFVVLLTIVMTMMLIRTLGQASQGSVNPSEVWLVMGFTMLGHLPTVLTMSLFIAVVGTLSRMYLESEMVIWQVSGRNRIDFVDWMRMDLRYINDWSIWLDIKLIFKTFKVVLTGDGAS